MSEEEYRRIIRASASRYSPIRSRRSMAACKACGRALCDHPDTIYAGVIPAPNNTVPSGRTLGSVSGVGVPHPGLAGAESLSNTLHEV